MDRTEGLKRRAPFIRTSEDVVDEVLGDLSLRLSSFEEYNNNVIVCFGYLLLSSGKPLLVTSKLT